LPEEDAIENQVFRIDEDWSRSDEKEKEDILNQVFKKRERALVQAREAIDQLYSPGSNAGAEVGWLYWFAYDNINAAVNQARISDSDVSEKLEDLVEEFHDAVKIYGEDGEEVVRGYTPYDMKRWSQEAEGSLGRMPAPMRKLMRANGGKINQLISFAYSGTEAVTEGSSEENDLEMG
jgi:hypothetical protein